MPKRKRRAWVWARSPRVKINISASGSFDNVSAEPPLAEAVKIHLDFARERHGDRAVARFLLEQYKAASGRGYRRDDAFVRVGKQMKMDPGSVRNLLNRSAKRSQPKPEKFG